MTGDERPEFRPPDTEVTEEESAAEEDGASESVPSRAGADRSVRIAMLVCLILGVSGGIGLAKHNQADAAAQRRRAVEREAGRLAATRVAPPRTLPEAPFISPMPRFRPTLHDLPPMRVAGPVYPRHEPKGSEDIVTDLDLPFAFRLRGKWGCDVSGDMPDATARHCEPYSRNDLPAAGKGRLRVIVRRCREGCGAAVQKRMHADWLGQWSYQVPPWKVLPTPAGTLDDTTRYVQKRSGGMYVLVMSHFFTGPRGVRYHVGAAVDCPIASTAAFQKIINDIRTQTS